MSHPPGKPPWPFIHSTSNTKVTNNMANVNADSDSETHPPLLNAKSADVGINISPECNSKVEEETNNLPKGYEPPSRTKIYAFISFAGFLMASTMGLSGLSLYYIWEIMKSNDRWNAILDEREKFPVNVLKDDIVFGGRKLKEIEEIYVAPRVRAELHREDPTHQIVFYLVSVFLGILLLHFIIFLVIKKVRLNFQVTAIIYALDAAVLFCVGVVLLLALTRVNLRFLRARVYFERTWDPEGHNASCVRTAINNSTLDKYHLEDQESEKETQEEIDGEDEPISSNSIINSEHKPVHCCFVKHIQNKTSQKLLFAMIKTCAYVSTKKNPRDPCRGVEIPEVIFRRKGRKRIYSYEDLTALLVCPDEVHLRIIMYVVGAACFSALCVLWFSSYALHVLLEPAYWKKKLLWNESGVRDWKSRRKIPSFMLTELTTDAAELVETAQSVAFDDLVDTPLSASRQIAGHQAIQTGNPSSKRQARNLMKLVPKMVVHPPTPHLAQEGTNARKSVAVTHKPTRSSHKIETLNTWFSE